MQTTYTPDEVSAALNHAADDILEAARAGDEGLRDAINLMVNAASSYLTGSARTLAEVAEQSYDVSLDDILGWIARGGVH